MLNCHDATRLMSESQERPLTLAERMTLKLHVSMCSGCRNFKDQMGTLRQMARSFAKREQNASGKECRTAQSREETAAKEPHDGKH